VAREFRERGIRFRMGDHGDEGGAAARADEERNWR
jgi:hypothetical protein